MVLLFNNILTQTLLVWVICLKAYYIRMKRYTPLVNIKILVLSGFFAFLSACSRGDADNGDSPASSTSGIANPPIPADNNVSSSSSDSSSSPSSSASSSAVASSSSVSSTSLSSSSDSSNSSSSFLTLNNEGTAGQSCQTLLDAGNSASGFYWLNPNGTAFVAFCEMSFDGGGWVKIAESDADTAALWQDLIVGNVSVNNQRLDTDRINEIWNLPGNNRLLIKCSDDSHWGSAEASNWYQGNFEGNFRSNCDFSYGQTINQYGSSWYMQNGNGQCLHGDYYDIGATGGAVRCDNSNLQFFIREVNTYDNNYSSSSSSSDSSSSDSSSSDSSSSDSSSSSSPPSLASLDSSYVYTNNSVGFYINENGCGISGVSASIGSVYNSWGNYYTFNPGSSWGVATITLSNFCGSSSFSIDVYDSGSSSSSSSTGSPPSLSSVDSSSIYSDGSTGFYLNDNGCGISNVYASFGSVYNNWGNYYTYSPNSSSGSATITMDSWCGSNSFNIEVWASSSSSSSSDSSSSSSSSCGTPNGDQHLYGLDFQNTSQATFTISGSQGYDQCTLSYTNNMTCNCDYLGCHITVVGDTFSGTNGYYPLYQLGSSNGSCSNSGQSYVYVWSGSNYSSSSSSSSDSSFSSSSSSSASYIAGATYPINPDCGSDSCSQMVLVKASSTHSIGGSDSADAWNNLYSICSSYGYSAPTTSHSGASGTMWHSGTNSGYPVTSNIWNPTWPWILGSLANGFEGGRVWIAAGDPGWLGVAVYPSLNVGENLLSNQGGISWESYQPSGPGSGPTIYSGQVNPGDFIMCAVP